MKRLEKVALVGLSCCIVSFLAGCASNKVESPVEPLIEKTQDSKFDKDGFIEAVKQVAVTGDYENALSMFAKVPGKYKNDFDLNMLKARLLDVSGRYEECYDLCVQMQEKNGESQELNDLLLSMDKKIFMTKLQVQLKSKNYDNAIALFDTLKEQNAAEYDIIFLKASVLASAGRLDEAQALCDKLIAADSTNVQTLDLAATIARMRGDNKTKSAYVNKVLKKDPYNVDANVTLAESSMSVKNYTGAQTYYRKALKSEPDNTDVLLGLSITQYFLEQDDKCKETLDKIVALDENNSQAYYYMAKLNEANKQYKLACDNIEKAIARDDSNYNYYLDYGMYLRGVGRFDDAIKAWDKAIELDSTYFLAYAYRAGINDEMGNYQKAITDYKNVIKCNPKYYYSYESLGVLALREKDWKTAREAFMTCAQFNNKNVSYPLLVTYCYYMEGNNVEAQKYSESVYRKMNRDTMDYKMLRIYHDLKGYENISMDIAKMANYQERGKMYFYMALLYSMFDNSSMAKEYYTKVLDMNSAMFFEYRLAEWSVEISND